MLDKKNLINKKGSYSPNTSVCNILILSGRQHPQMLAPGTTLKFHISPRRVSRKYLTEAELNPDP